MRKIERGRFIAGVVLNPWAYNRTNNCTQYDWLSFSSYEDAVRIMHEVKRINNEPKTEIFDRQLMPA